VFPEHGAIDIKLKRGLFSGFVNAHNKTLHRLFQCNHDVRFMTGGATATTYYTVKYTAKAQELSHIIINLAGKAMRRRIAREQHLEHPPERPGISRLLSVFSQATSIMTIGAPMAMLELLHGFEYSSHKVKNLLIKQGIEFFTKGIFDGVVTELDIGMYATIPSIYDYFYRGPELSYYDSVMWYEKKKGTEAQFDGLAASVNEGDRSTPQRASSDNKEASEHWSLPTPYAVLEVYPNKRVSLLNQHPLHAIHLLCQRSVPFVPMLLGSRACDRTQLGYKPEVEAGIPVLSAS
jgi:hypothetical protein